MLKCADFFAGKELMMTVESHYCNCRGNSLEQERPVQHQTVQHKKLYERNAQMQQNIRQYFEVRLNVPLQPNQENVH